MVEKKTKTVYLCACELKGCKKSWESEGDTIPERCRWCGRRTWNSPPKRQHLLTAYGKTQTIASWARETGIGKATIRSRILAGWSPADTLKPIQSKVK